MTRASKIIIGFGIFAGMIPLLGFPGVVKDGLTVILGLSIAAIMYWGEKHAKFCPECKLPEGPTHDHVKREGQTPAEISTQGAKSSSVPSTFSVGSDIMPRDTNTKEIEKSADFRTDLAPSPFSFDAEKAKSQKSRGRGERRKVVSG